VLVCREHDSSLYSSAVTINGTSAGNSLATAPAGTTDAELCGITAGARSGLHANTLANPTHSAAVAIP
jgi:hypothetical protein